MRLLVLSHSSVLGAYQEKLAHLAALPGWEVHLLSPFSWPEGRPKVLQERPFPQLRYHCLLCVAKGHVGRHFYIGLAGLAKRLRPDLIYAEEEFYALSSLQAACAAKALRIPFGFFTWENIARPYQFPFEWSAKRVLELSAFSVVGNSEARQVLAGRGFQGPTALVPQYGVNPERFKPAGRKPAGKNQGKRRWTLGFLGRLVPEKGLDILLASLPLLRFPYQLKVAGHGPLRQELRRQCPQAEVLEALPYEAVPGFLQELDVLILPSRSTPRWKEQFGRVLAEAMACGTPCVGSSSGAIPEVIGPGGLVFQEGSAQDLAKQLNRLALQAGLHARLAVAGRRHALRHYSHQALAGRLAQFLSTQKSSAAVRPF